VIEKAAYVIGMAFGGLIEAMGMQWENEVRMSRGEQVAYDGKAFKKLVEERGLDHNALMEKLGGE